MGNLAHHQAVVRVQALRHAAVDHGHLQLLSSGKHSQGQLIGQQHVHRLVRGSGTGVGDPFNGQSMVGGKDQQLRAVQNWLERVLHQAQADREWLQFAQAATCLAAPRQFFAQGPFQQRAGSGGDQ